MTTNNPALKQHLIILAAALLMVGMTPVGALAQGQPAEQPAAAQPPNTITIESTGDQRAFYEFTVSGQIEYGERANLAGDETNPTHPDEISGTTASGAVAEGGIDNYHFSGEITAFELTGGPADISVNGERIDPDAVTATTTAIPTATTTATNPATARETDTPTSMMTRPGNASPESSPTTGTGTIGTNLLLLDTDRQKIESVHINGSTYTIYRYENMLPYASGIEVYANGERVTSGETVRTVIQTGAWQRATSELDSDDIETLRQINQSTSRINKVVTPPLALLNQVLGEIHDLKQREVAGQAVWDILTTASPTISSFESSARELRNGLQEWKTAADQVNQNVPLLINDLERMERGKDVDYETVFTHFSATMTGLDQLRSQSANLSDQLSSVSQSATTVSSEVSGVPLVGDEVSQRFADTSDGLETAATDVETFSDELGQQQSKLSEVKSNAESEEERMMKAWKTRQTAELKVYGTLGGGTLLGVFVLLSFIRRL